MKTDLLLYLLVSVFNAVVSEHLFRSDHCAELAHQTWENPGGLSAGLDHCIREIVRLQKGGHDYYTLMDAANVPGVTLRNVSDISQRFHVTVDMPFSRLPFSGEFGDAQWIIPPGYQQAVLEPRIVFLHGSDASVNAMGSYYAGFTARLANWTGMPVLAFNYLAEPVAPWPQNVRSVLDYITYALSNGPNGPGLIGPLFIVADSAAALLAMQTVLAIVEKRFLMTLGYEGISPVMRKHLAGVILSSPVVDVACETPSFAWNCFNEQEGKGDPDTGNCSGLPSLSDRIADCRWSYLLVFFGFSERKLMSRAKANEEWLSRRDFFEQGLVNPLRANLKGMPPLMILGGVRDYFYSDSPTLAALACSAGVDVEVFNVGGAFHDFIEYSEGCGGPAKMEEALQAYARIRAFVSAKTSKLPWLPGR